jgi:hypothetical protein
MSEQFKVGKVQISGSGKSLVITINGECVGRVPMAVIRSIARGGYTYGVVYKDEVVA